MNVLNKSSDSEEYAVRQGFFDEICYQFGLTPTLDLFGSEKNAKCKRLGSPDDVFDKPWPENDILWVDPPGPCGLG